MTDSEDRTIIKGKKRVRLHNDGYGLVLLTMRNGYQWTGMPVDDEILDMLQRLIHEYQSHRDSGI